MTTFRVGIIPIALAVCFYYSYPASSVIVSAEIKCFARFADTFFAIIFLLRKELYYLHRFIGFSFYGLGGGGGGGVSLSPKSYLSIQIH